MTVSTSTRKLFSKCRVLGQGAQKIALSESEMFALMHVSCHDLKWNPHDVGLPTLSCVLPDEQYYKIPLEWFVAHQEESPTSRELLKILARAVSHHQDFSLYYQNICSLHKRRLKYQRILSKQPRPNMDQIGPRSLLEFGLYDSDFLFSWMVWRKWLFDIDNRAAQETGYLFEPILASCLGGESISARHSPVKRLDKSEKPTGGARQIDCYIGDEDLAYEFKLRVTIAASGQGRFAEELSFPVECAAAGLTPILIVLDPTPSPRLAELEQAFLAAGGKMYIGQSAWQHMQEQAGTIMSTFLEKYLRPPLEEMAKQEGNKLLDVQLSWSDNSIIIQAGEVKYEIPRKQQLRRRG